MPALLIRISPEYALHARAHIHIFRVTTVETFNRSAYLAS